MNIKLAPTIDLDSILANELVNEVVGSATAADLLNVGSDTAIEGAQSGSATTNATNKDGSSTTDTNGAHGSDTTATKGQRVNQWRKENRDTLRIDLPKGLKAILQDEAETRNVSVTTMIRQALSQYLGRDV